MAERDFDQVLARFLEEGADAVDLERLVAQARERGESDALIALLELRSIGADLVDTEPPGGDWSGFEEGLAAKLDDARADAIATEPVSEGARRRGNPSWAAAAAAAVVVSLLSAALFLRGGVDDPGAGDAIDIAQRDERAPEPSDRLPVDAGSSAAGGALTGDDTAADAETSGPRDVRAVPSERAPDGVEPLDAKPDTLTGPQTAPQTGPQTAAGDLAEPLAPVDPLDALTLAEIEIPTGESWEPVGFGGSPLDPDAGEVGLFPDVERLTDVQRERLWKWLQEENEPASEAS